MNTYVLNILDKLPTFLRILPYKFAYYILRIACPSKLQLTFRNSIYYGYFVCAKSDLDLTISTKLPVENHIRIISLFIRRYKIIKKFLPYIGEINIYDSQLKEFIGFANYYELRRDPFLRVLSHNTRNDASTAVFLLRMLFSDLKNLNNKMSLRRKKWNFHIREIIGKDYIDKKFNSFTELQNELIRFISNPEYKKIILSLNQDSSLSSKQLFLRNPTEWIIANLTKDNYQDEIKAFALERCEIDLYIEHIQWEIFGLYSQIFLLFKDYNLDQYCSILLENIGLVCEDIAEQEYIDKFNYLNEGLTNLQTLTKKYMSLSK